MRYPYRMKKPTKKPYNLLKETRALLPYRQVMGLSQPDMAEKIGASFSWYQKFELNKLPNVRLDLVQKLHDVLWKARERAEQSA